MFTHERPETFSDPWVWLLAASMLLLPVLLRRGRRTGGFKETDKGCAASHVTHEALSSDVVDVDCRLASGRRIPVALSEEALVADARRQIGEALALPGESVVLVNSSGRKPRNDEHIAAISDGVTSVVLLSPLLRPSWTGAEIVTELPPDIDGAGLMATAESHVSGAVTCLRFGQEELHQSYILLAAGTKGGEVAVYRCYRTQMEVEQLDEDAFPQGGSTSFITPPTTCARMVPAGWLHGHSDEITSICFSTLKNRLATASNDKSVCLWDIEDGVPLRALTDSSPVTSVAFLPLNPQVIVVGNCSGTLRSVSTAQPFLVLQKFQFKAKIESSVASVVSLSFDASGLFLMAGTSHGSIYVFQVSDSNDPLAPKFLVQVPYDRGLTRLMTYARGSQSQPPCMVVTTDEENTHVMECVFDDKGILTGMVHRKKVHLPEASLWSSRCYSPSGPGYFVSAGMGAKMCAYSLAEGSTHTVQHVTHNVASVNAVAVNFDDTVLASGDAHGKIVLWRRPTLTLHG